MQQVFYAYHNVNGCLVILTIVTSILEGEQATIVSKVPHIKYLTVDFMKRNLKTYELKIAVCGHFYDHGGHGDESLS